MCTAGSSCDILSKSHTHRNKIGFFRHNILITLAPASLGFALYPHAFGGKGILVLTDQYMHLKNCLNNLGVRTCAKKDRERVIGVEARQRRVRLGY